MGNKSVTNKSFEPRKAQKKPEKDQIKQNTDDQNQHQSVVESKNVNELKEQKQKEIDKQDIFASRTDIFNWLQWNNFNQRFLLVDFRALESYDKAHIQAAIHHLALNDSSLLNDSKVTVVLHHEDSKSMEQLQKKRIKLLEDYKVTCKILKHGFNGFCEKYPFLIENSNQNTFLNYPNEIIKNQLYLGDFNHAYNKQILEDLKITHIVNVTKKYQNKYQSQGIYYKNKQISLEISSDYEDF